MSSDRGRKESFIWDLSTILKGLIQCFSGQEPILNVLLPLEVATDYRFLKMPVYRVIQQASKVMIYSFDSSMATQLRLFNPLKTQQWCVCVCVCVLGVGSGESLAPSLFLTPTIFNILSLTFITTQFNLSSIQFLAYCRRLPVDLLASNLA